MHVNADFKFHLLSPCGFENLVFPLVINGGGGVGKTRGNSFWRCSDCYSLQHCFLRHDTCYPGSTVRNTFCSGQSPKETEKCPAQAPKTLIKLIWGQVEQWAVIGLFLFLFLFKSPGTFNVQRELRTTAQDDKDKNLKKKNQ